MTELTLTRKAAAGLYAAVSSLIIEERAARKYNAVLPDGVSTFVLHTSGLVSCKGEKDVARQAGVPFVGLPYGLLAFVVSKGMRPIVKSFLQFAQEQKPRYMPEVLVVPTFGLFRKNKLSHSFNIILSRNLSDKNTSLSAAARQLVELREKNEQLSLSFEKARRMIVGAGYSTRTICFDLPAGSESIGPSENEVSYSYGQILPVDLASFTGISLFVARAAPVEEGVLSVILRRRSDSAIIGASTVPYVSLKAGWHHFAMQEVAGRTFGDGILQLEWQGANGPHFALAEEIADRFGAEDGSTLALRIERGLVEPARLMDASAFERHNVRSKLDAKALSEQGRFFGGAEEEAAQATELGAEVLRLDKAGRWFQTHVLKENLAALELPQSLAAGITEVRAKVSLAHRHAAPCVALLVIAPAGSLTTDTVKNWLKQHKDKALAATGQSESLQWAAKVLTPGDSDFIELKFAEALSAEHDMLLGVLPLVAGKNGFGWCRWQHVTLTQQVKALENIAGVSQQLTEFAGSRAAQIRVHRFPEIAGHLSYYQGRQRHIGLREELGFWPLEFSDDTGAMQLHPLKNGVCAAVLESGLPENVRRVACEVGTAHSQADEFIYIVGTMPVGEELAATIDGVAASIKDGLMVGSNAAGAQWAAVTLKAREKSTLEMMLQQTSGRGQTIFFATLPAVQGKTSYGWCRWYLLSFEMQPYDGGITLLETESTKGVVGE